MESFPFTLLGCSHGDADARTPVLERYDYPDCTIEYIVEGKGTLETNGRHFECRANDVYILHRHSSHRYWPDRADPWHKLFFVVQGKLMEELFRIYGMDEVHYLPNVPQLKSFFEMVFTLGFGAEADRRCAVLFHQFVEAAARICREEANPAPRRFTRLKRLLDTQVLDEPFQLSRYAAEQEISAPHLIRGFKQYFGQTPGEYWMARRQDAAVRLLRYSTLSVKEIALNLGFSDAYHFSNSFKRHNGKSPTAFRNDT